VKVSNRLAWLPMAAMTAMTVLLMAILVFLYARTQQHGESDYFENVTLMRHIRQLDAQWELDVLKSRIGINSHYDPLADSLTQLSTLLERFESNAQTQRHDESIAVAAAALRGVIQEKAGLIEQFKSSNAVLRNSLAFLPTAAEDVQQLLDRTGEREPSASASESKRISVTVNNLLLASLLYSQSASDDRGAEIQRALGRLDAGRRLVPRGLRYRLEIFGAHVGTILREQRAVNELLSRITDAPTTARANDVSNALIAEQRLASVQNERYREYLLVFSAGLIALLLYAAVRLVRSRAVIKRVNQDLHGANENLEQRVQERTHELRQAQGELVAAARQAGMAEIATNLLHNVGNVLNSVNVSAGLITSSVRASKVQGLSRAVQLMNEHADDLAAFLASDARGRMLPGYLGQLAQVLVTEQQGVVEELMALTKSVDHIKEIIATQQAHAGASGLIESLQIRDLVEDALRMNVGALTRNQVTVEKEFAPVPELPLDKGRILQILVNLIGNAKQAMEGVADRAHRLTLRVEVQGVTLRVCVTDNGVGIAPENLTRVFAHGFTTKKDGHGFGLHSAAIAAREMGGTLTGHSDGPNTGATFTLELPVEMTEEKIS
jgi:two-component system, NtrC family, sensor kinase